MTKKIIAGAVAVVAAIIVLKILSYILFNAISFIFNLVWIIATIVILGLIAIPIYLLIDKKFLK